MIIIKKAHPGNVELISLFQERMALETENLKLDPCTLRRGVSAVFSDPVKGCYYIAEIEGKIAGSLLITYEWSDWRNGMILWIQSVYVLPEYRNKGVFRHLYNHIKKMVEDDPGHHGIRLYVDRTNKRAMDVYSRYGMNGGHYRLFEWIKFSR